ncbi:hypothetical protein L596_008839 [Steinernema carpocapsae]|uniref:Ferritin n=1 Tax=Steinernema carpocapsae TaxID=34508 RepID=A0A4U5PET6_STECR|nr:hypothetical protein L596_008839 [Steinernema carpocapsae]
MSAIRQQYHVSAENAVNEQVSNLMNASYAYLNIAYYFDRSDVALENLHKHFEKLAEKKQAMYEKLLKYQNVRGGRIVLQAIQKPEHEHFTSPENALQVALQIEQGLNEKFIGLHEIADKTNDAHFSDMVEEDLLDAQVQEIKSLADLLTSCKRAGSGLGVFMFDKELED